MSRPSCKVRATLLQDGHGHVEVNFDKPLDVSAMLDLLRAAAQKLFSSPELYLSFEGDPKSVLRDFEHCKELVLNPPSPATCHEVSVGLPDSDDLVSISLDRMSAVVGIDEPSKYAAGFLSVLSEPFGEWKGLGKLAGKPG